MAKTLIDCIQSVCTQADQTNKVLKASQTDANNLALALRQSEAALKCVVNGAVGQSCNLPEAGQLITLAEAISRLNACQINSIGGQNFTATAAQKSFTLAAAPANPYALEVALNGAICSDPSDYSIAGSALTFVSPLTVGDNVSVRVFTP